MKKKVYGAVASVMGIGFLPIAPGTWASLLGIGIWYAAQSWIDNFNSLQWLFPVVCIVVGTISANEISKKWGYDSQKIVVDELAGMWIACLAVPHQPSLLITAFILFRFFDIVKPLGIRRFEKLKGGWGIMMDDVVAGIYTNLILHLYLFIKN